eukprot:6184347-Pleurochrysis_carterae.AAC.4
MAAAAAAARPDQSQKTRAHWSSLRACRRQSCLLCRRFRAVATRASPRQAQTAARWRRARRGSHACAVRTRRACVRGARPAP